MTSDEKADTVALLLAYRRTPPTLEYQRDWERRLDDLLERLETPDPFGDGTDPIAQAPNDARFGHLDDAGRVTGG